MADELKVTQADRDAAWSMDRQKISHCYDKGLVDAGRYDHVPAIQQFARHRIATETQSQATIDELVAERKAIIEHIPMDYLERHGVGASAPADAEKLKRAMRDYAEDRWKLLDRLKDAIAKAGGQS